jgi:hypothetical protein
MDAGWKVVIPHDGINFGIAQKLNEFRPTSPCCGEFLEDYFCQGCKKNNFHGHPAATTWVINDSVTIWNESDLEAGEYGLVNWVVALTGLRKKDITVTIS